MKMKKALTIKITKEIIIMTIILKHIQFPILIYLFILREKKA